MTRISLIASLILILGTHIISAQSVILPNYGLRSHETMEIRKVDMGPEGTIFYMSIVNRIKGGSFCADKNIVLVYPDGTSEKLIRAEGIPTCPDQFRFRYDGERLDFMLRFPPIRQGTQWVDLIEMCNDNCFSMYGVTLNNTLNDRINGIFARIGKEKPAVIIPEIVRLIDETDQQNNGAEGLLYLTVIKLYREAGDNEKASEWYGRFMKSGAPSMQKYIQNLNAQGIKY